MKKTKILNILILLILLLGLAFSWSVDRYIDADSKKEAEIPQEESAPIAESFLEGEKLYYEYIKKSLDETKIRNQGIRKENQSGSNIRQLNIFSSELKDWERKLDIIYDEILRSVDEQQAEALAKQQQEWRLQRDLLATEAASKESGSKASLEYVKSQVESTRLRAYGLLEEYRAVFEKSMDVQPY